ncbi:hypothetical protein ACFLT4_06535 [Chloroflexota bacterium]
MNIKEVADKIHSLEVRIPKVDSIFTVYFIKEAKGVLIEPGPASTRRRFQW